MTENFEAIFCHNQELITIQIGLNEKWEDVIKKYENKSGLEIQSVYFIYSGNQINKEYTIEQIINSDDKISKKMKILVNDILKEPINEEIIKSKDIICPICKKSIKIKIKEYKIYLYGCQNGHEKDNILLEEFDSMQDEMKIKCGKCENMRNKIYNNIFYKCNKCEINLCPLCKSIHDKTHNIINYEQRNYICRIHNEQYNSYCENCNVNICMECEEMHYGHKIIYFGKIKPNSKEIEKLKGELINGVNNLKEEIKKIINILNKVIVNTEKYMNINIKIINNLEGKNRNYEIMNNMKEIINNNEIIEDINKIYNEKEINNKFKKILDVYNKMNKKVNYNKETKINKEEGINEKLIYRINEDIIISDEIKYKIENKDKIKIFGNNFVKNNKDKCKIIYENQEYELIDEFNIVNNNEDILKIKLKGINKVTNLSSMFDGCSS